MNIEDVLGGLYAALALATVGLFVVRLRTHYWHRAALALCWGTLACRLSVRWFSQVATIPHYLDQFTRSRIVISMQLELVLIVTLSAIVLEWRRE